MQGGRATSPHSASASTLGGEAAGTDCLPKKAPIENLHLPGSGRCAGAAAPDAFRDAQAVHRTPVRPDLWLSTICMSRLILVTIGLRHQRLDCCVSGSAQRYREQAARSVSRYLAERLIEVWKRELESIVHEYFRIHPAAFEYQLGLGADDSCTEFE
ncbi:hypothetical protein ABH922_004394 [Rhodococcus sp. 27YEA15]